MMASKLPKRSLCSGFDGYGAAWLASAARVIRQEARSSVHVVTLELAHRPECGNRPTKW
jgi:hypothetical protein